MAPHTIPKIARAHPLTYSMPIENGFVIRAHLVQIVARFEDVKIIHLLACQVNDVGMLFRLRQKIQRIQKVQYLDNHPENFGTNYYQFVCPSQFHKLSQ